MDSLCALCESKEETASHLLISCSITNVVWNSCSKWIGVTSKTTLLYRNTSNNFIVLGSAEKVISCGKECECPSFGAFGNT